MKKNKKPGGATLEQAERYAYATTVTSLRIVRRSRAELMEVLEHIASRYRPVGQKRHCWLCNADLVVTGDEHFPGCIYPMVCAALARSEERA